MEIELKLLFPTIIQINFNPHEFIGVLTSCENENVFVSFHVPNYPDANELRYTATVPLSDSDAAYLTTKSKHLNFLEYLKMFSRALRSKQKQRVFDIDLFTCFYSEYIEVQKQMPHITCSFGNETITITYLDQYGVENVVSIKLDFYQGRTHLYNVIEHNFPSVDSKPLFPKQSSLDVICKQFMEYVTELSQFKELMHNIDTICWVIAPANPTYKHNFRRIVIDSDNSVSIQLTFDPWDMTSLPKIQFFGPSSAVETYRDVFTENLVQWQLTDDVMQNILRLLDLPFFPVEPMTEDSTKSDMEIECSICFDYYLNEMAPDIVCPNDLCQKQFHNECLYQCLSELSNLQIMYDSINGKCPACQKNISCKVPER